jgi:hypothetical protein
MKLPPRFGFTIVRRYGPTVKPNSKRQATQPGVSTDVNYKGESCEAAQAGYLCAICAGIPHMMEK